MRGEFAARLGLETQSELQAVLVRLNALRGRLEDGDADAETRLRELEDAIADIRETQAAMLERASVFEEALDAERQRYHDLFDRAPDAYLVTDRSGKILDSNLGASALLGRAETFLRGKPLPVFVVSSERRQLRSKLLGLAGGAHDEFELVLETPAGPRDVEVRAASEDVRQPLIRWLLRDVTDRKRAEAEVQALNEELERRIDVRTRELTETSARLYTVLQQLPDGVLIFDGEGELQLGNKRAEELLGQPADRLGLAVEEMRSSPQWPLARVLETGEPAKLDRVELDRDGTPLLLELEVVPVRSGNAIVAVVMEFNDVTDRERRERAERNFVTNAAHQLQTPIAAIASAIDVLQAGAKDRPEDRDRFLDHIERVSTRLGNLTRALLVLARAQNRSEQPRAEVIQLAPLLSSIADMTAEHAIEVSCPDDVAVIANRPLLEQALANLSENAVKYAGGQVQLAAGRENGRVSIDVVDRGPGIPEPHRSHVFERFYRGDGDGEGFGLGLAIVREAVDALGGELALDSGPEGTRVSIALPRGADTPDVTRILVAEDEPAILDAVAYTLRGEGYDVETVEDGEQALAQAHRNGFDLLILDLMLPKLSGTEILRRVRSTSALPVIVLTARTAEADRVLGLEIGADDYITKPFSMAELVSRVRAILRRRELDRGGPIGPITVGGLELDPYRHRVLVDGDPRHVTRSEFKLLALLASEPERPFSRRELMQHLWESDYVGDQRACDIHISNLRRKVERDPARPQRIATVRGVGYKLVAV